MEIKEGLGKGKFLVLVLSMMFVLSVASIVSAEFDSFRIVSETGDQEDGYKLIVLRDT